VEEWQYDFDYAMTSDESYGAGQLHRGFVGIGEQMWNNGLHSVLRKHVLQGEGTVSHITITGHSLGAATASLLAAKTQRYLARAVAASVQEQQQAQPPLQPTVSAVLFAAPNVGDEAFAADFNTRVNTRNIRCVLGGSVSRGACAGLMTAHHCSPNLRVRSHNCCYLPRATHPRRYQSDIVTQAPCAKSMPVCPVSAKRKASGGAAAPAAAAAMTEDRIVEMLLGGGGGLDDDEEATIEDAPSSAAGNSSVGTSSSQASPAWTFVSYAELGGQLVLDASDMPYQQSAWKQLSLYQQVCVEGMSHVVCVCVCVCVCRGWACRGRACTHLHSAVADGACVPCVCAPHPLLAGRVLRRPQHRRWPRPGRARVQLCMSAEPGGGPGRRRPPQLVPVVARGRRGPCQRHLLPGGSPGDVSHGPNLPTHGPPLMSVERLVGGVREEMLAAAAVLL
jgi:hypothetical protein